MTAARRWLGVVGVAALLAASAAWGCGHCVEDRIAAVYDHALTQRTAAQAHRIAYFAWDGPIARDEVSRRKLLALVQAVAGVDQGSARVAMEPAAIAVAFDPRRGSEAALAAALQSKLKGLRVTVVPLNAARAGGL